MALFAGVSIAGRYAMLGVTIAVLIGFLYGVYYWNEHYRKHQPDILALKPAPEDDDTARGEGEGEEDRV